MEDMFRQILRERQEEKQRAEEKRQQETAELYSSTGRRMDLKAYWLNGFQVETADRAFRLHIGGLLHTEAGWWGAGENVMYGPDGVGALNDGAMFRRARLHFVGGMYDTVNWTLEIGFENRLPQFFNAFAELPDLPHLGTLRMGHFREPFGMDGLTSYNTLTFLERAMVNDPFVPFFNMGMMLYGTRWDERITYAAGIFRTNSDNFNSAAFSDGAYSYTNRLTFNPWYEADGAYTLHLGAAYSYRVLSYLNAQGQPVATGGLRRINIFARPEERVNAPTFIQTGVLQADHEQLVGTELGLGLGPVFFQAEYMASMVSDALPPGRTPQTPAARSNLLYHGGYIQGSWFITGESRPYLRRDGFFGVVRPRENFVLVRTDDPNVRLPRGPGAWELALRYSQVDLNDQAVEGGAMRAVTFGLNWYLNPSCRFLWNYLLTWRDGPESQSDGLVQSFGARFQIEW